MLPQYFRGGPHIRHREEGTDLLCAFSRPGVGVLNVDPSCAQLACCTPESAGFVGQDNLDDVFLRRFPAAFRKGLFGGRRFINDQSNRIPAVRNRCHEANDVHLLRAQGGGRSTQHPRPIIYPYAKLLRFWHGVSSIKNCDLAQTAAKRCPVIQSRSTAERKSL